MKDTTILPEGYKQTKAGVIPTEWDVVKFSQVCKKALNGGTPSTKIPEYWEGTIPWITGADVVDQRIREVRKCITAEAVENSATHVVPKGMLLLVTRTGVGKVAVAPFDIAISQDLTGIIPTDNASVEYLFWTFNRANGHFLNMNQGTSINGIKRNDLMNFALPLPPLPEQHRIATVLSTVDAAIAATDEVIAKTEDLKRGLMQDLLTKGIDEEGRVRSEETHAFKDTKIGRLPAGWDIKNIDQIKSKKRHAISMGPFGSDITVDNFKPSGIPVIRGINLGAPILEDKHFVFINEDKANELAASNAYKRDIVLTHRGTIGQVSIIPDGSKYSRYVVSQSQMKLTCDEDIINPYFVNFYFNSPLGKKRWLSYRAHTGVPAIGQPISSLKSLKIPIPPLDEQHRITKILTKSASSLDLERDHRARLQTLKKGLMQDLLTGRTRVPLNGGDPHGA